MEQHLQIALSCAVPLRIAELKAKGGFLIWNKHLPGAAPNSSELSKTTSKR